MNINLHIERLVLDGIDIATASSEDIGIAVQRELTRLMATQPKLLSRGLNIYRVRGESIAFALQIKADTVGAGIAQSLFRELRPQAGSGERNTSAQNFMPTHGGGKS